MVQMNLRFAETPELEGKTDAYAGLNWSYSRREALEHCTRRYFFQYYASALPSGDFKTKVNFLRGVKNRYLRTGEIVHLMIATHFKKLKIGRNLSEDWLMKWAKDLLAEDRKYSLHIRNGGASAHNNSHPQFSTKFLTVRETMKFFWITQKSKCWERSTIFSARPPLQSSDRLELHRKRALNASCLLLAFLSRLRER
ncbi:MAG: hypothetical protein DMF21_13765 [Verrucomicrobia bacterium]|nr:MAG: hypothetical protein DMF21_13765 [Verrucomicrobiota bacterium]